MGSERIFVDCGLDRHISEVSGLKSSLEIFDKLRRGTFEMFLRDSRRDRLQIFSLLGHKCHFVVQLEVRLVPVVGDRVFASCRLRCIRFIFQILRKCKVEPFSTVNGARKVTELVLEAGKLEVSNYEGVSVDTY